jgi:hypothetical protein
VLQHVGEQRAFAQRFAASDDFPRLLGAAEEALRAIAETNLKRRFPATSAAQRKDTAVYIAGGFIGLLRWWMQTGLVHAPDRIEVAFARLTENALREEE